MFTSYSETIAYLYDNLPMFQRVGAVALKNDLSNTLKLCAALDNPQGNFKSIHVGGTNGKGSTSHMLASILQSAGYKTGLYTSPHLKDFTERIRVNGQPVAHDFIVDFVNRMRPLIETIKPSFFEITVAMAFEYFARQKVDMAVVEVGLGGRLDSTNVIEPELSLITNIGWDHKELLGDTLEKIASEKAGIIKAGTPVIVSERQKEVEQVFIEKAKSVGAPLFFASDEYSVLQHIREERSSLEIYHGQEVIFPGLELPLQGFYQRKNVGGVLKAVALLQEKGVSISTGQVADGLSKVVSQTGLKGRWQRLGSRPFIVCDTGHNMDGIAEVARQIGHQTYDNLYIVWGMVKDKDPAPILRLLPKEANYYFCQAKIPRALDAQELSEQARQVGLSGTVVRDVNDAIRQAKSQAHEDDMIFIGGSTFVVAEIDGL